MSTDDLTKALLQAGRREHAPKGSDQRVLAALGVGGGTSAFAGLSDGLARLGLKGLLLSTATVLAITGTTVWAMHHDAPPPPAPALAPAAPPPAVIAPPPPAAIETAELPTTRIEDLPSSTPVPSARPLAPERAGLAREVELVEAARAALARGDVPAALRALDAHDREVPDGILMPESRMLRSEALSKKP